MCEPMTIIAATSAVVGAVGARQNAEGQAKNMARQRAVQARQQHSAASDQAGQRVKQARAEQARLRVAAGEAGIAGQSFEAQLMDSSFQLDQDLARINSNAAMANEAGNEQLATAFSNVNNPSLLESGLQIAGVTYGAHRASKAIDAQIETSDGE